MRYLTWILLLISTSALADARIVPDGRGGYRVIEERRSALGDQIIELNNQPTLLQQYQEREIQQQQLEQLRLQNELLRKQLEQNSD